MESAFTALSKHLGFDLRMTQIDAISAVLNGLDVLVVLSTVYGKSIVYIPVTALVVCFYWEEAVTNCSCNISTGTCNSGLCSVCLTCG